MINFQQTASGIHHHTDERKKTTSATFVKPSTKRRFACHFKFKTITLLTQRPAGKDWRCAQWSSLFVKTGRRNNFQVSTNSTTHDKEERTSAAFLVAMISKKGREKHWSSLGTTLLTEATTLVGSTPVWTTPLGTIHVWTISDWTTRIFGLSPFGLPMTFGPK